MQTIFLPECVWNVNTLTLAMIFCSPRKCTTSLQKLVVKPYTHGMLQPGFDIHHLTWE